VSYAEDARAQICRRLTDAAFTYDTHVLDLVLNEGYKPDSEEHRGDVFDHALLEHLAAPGLIFITADKKLRIIRH